MQHLPPNTKHKELQEDYASKSNLFIQAEQVHLAYVHSTLSTQLLSTINLQACYNAQNKTNLKHEKAKWDKRLKPNLIIIASPADKQDSLFKLSNGNNTTYISNGNYQAEKHRNN